MIVSVNNVDLYYECSGHGQPLILLHGNGEDHHIFDRLVIKLKDLFTVYSIDARGHGRSSKDCLLSYELMANDVVAFIRKINIDNPIIYGFSDGGITCLLLVVNHQELINRIIISGANINPFGFVWHEYLKYLFEYLTHHTLILKMMLTQPNITKHDLNKISVPVIITAGQYDVIRKKHTLYIHKHIKDSVLTFVDHHDHQSYVMDNDYLFDIILPYLTVKQ